MDSFEQTPQRWKDISVKEKAAIITACISFGLGFTLLFLGMLLPPQGEVHPTVLTAFGTALLYTAGIFGVSMYFKHGNNELMNGILNHLDQEIEKRLKGNDNSADN